VAVSDYVRAIPDSIARWLPGPLVSLGTDGYGRSDTREALRDFFEVDGRHVALAALRGLGDDRAAEAIEKLEIDTERAGPMGFGGSDSERS
jgi:pyruvate dehydrogenase E1 component